MQKLLIGRGQNCDIVLENTKKLVSREHATLYINDDKRCAIKDRESTNGTFLNKVRINTNQIYYLNPNDELIIADIKLNWEAYRDNVKVDRKTKERTRRMTVDQGKKNGAKPTPPPLPLTPPVRPPVQPPSKKPKWNVPPPMDGKIGSKIPPKQGTVLQRSVASDFFDKIIPIPALTLNVRLFWNLHINPVSKMLLLTEQSESEAEAHPYSFLGFALIVYAGFIALADSIFKVTTADLEGNGESLSNLDFQLKLIIESPVLAVCYSAILVFVYAYIAYMVLKNTNKDRTFNQYLKLTSLTQGMVLIHIGFMVFVVMKLASVMDLGEESKSEFIMLIFFLNIILIIYFIITNIRANRRFWGISWGAVIGYFILISIIFGIITHIVNHYVFEPLIQ